MIDLIRFEKYFNVVNNFYRSNSKYYHTIDHVKNMFYLFSMHEKDFDVEFGSYDKTMLFWSIAYHDSFYIPGYDYNEYISKEIAKTNINIVGHVNVKELEDIIMSTKPGYTDFNTSLKKIIHDLDWSGFIDYKTMVDNEKKIIMEAVEISNYLKEDVIKNQINFYNTFSKKQLYLTNTFSALNSIAKYNMIKRSDVLSNMFK